MDDTPTEGDEDTPRPPHRHRLRVPTLLVLLALLPILGMLALAAVSAQRLEREREAAANLEEEADGLMRLIAARAAIGAEEVASAVLVVGAELGVTAVELEAMFGEDFTGALADARAAVDADPTLQEQPRLARAVLTLVQLRPAIDAGEVTFVELIAVTGTVRDELDATWGRRISAHTARVLDNELPGAVQIRFQALTGAYTTLTSAADRALLTEVAITGDLSPEQLNDLVDATGTYRTLVRAFPPRLGPKGRTAWEATTSDPATARFQRVLDDTIAAITAGEDPPLRGDPIAFGNAFIDGPVWAAGITATVTGAAEDLRDLAAEQAQDATRAARAQLLLVVAGAALSLLAALLLARSVTRPARALATAAHQVQEGRFAIEPLPEHGPRELAETARAFNEMASTLAAVERHAVALADDVEDPMLREPLPGRTGQALQVALNRLRSSMRLAEERREELRQAATHDALTGLLNRAAAFEVVSRDLLRASRGAGPVVALFIDMDDLKPINDGHGHAAGDDALRLTAQAIQEATRATDVVARIGGDEFLVAGVLTPDGDVAAEAEELAERVRAHVASRSVSVGDGAAIPLRCTVGIALAGPGTTVEALVNEADRALLEAKRAGKDRVGWSSAPRPHPPTADGRLPQPNP